MANSYRAVLSALTLISLTTKVCAEATVVRIFKGFAITYMPMYVLEHEKLLEKHATAAKEFGTDQYAKLAALTVSLPHLQPAVSPTPILSLRRPSSLHSMRRTA
jgi:hypothetical protein